MAFTYEQGTASDLADWFTKLEAFVITAGWTVQDGSGTTTIIISSPGEQGGLTKLWAKFRRDTGANAYKVYYTVQDDLAGTHTTSDYEPIEAEGLGEDPFLYFMCGDKDMISIGFKRGSGYKGSYVGLVEPFAQNITDETHLMVAIGMHVGGVGVSGYMLRRYDDVWNQLSRWYGVSSYNKDPLDNSVALFGSVSLTMSYDDIKGQLKNVTAQIGNCPALNPEDTLTTGLAGATTTWIVLGTTTKRWAIRTGGTLPLGTPDGAHFAHQSQLADSFTDFFNKMDAFLTGVGWTVTDNSGVSGYTWDRIAYSTGEDATEDIYIRFYYDDVRMLVFNVQDDYAGTHFTSAGYIGGVEGPLIAGHFPTFYYITADRNCLYFTLNRDGDYQTVWAGMFKMFNPDAGSLATPYKVGGFRTPANTGAILRAHNGTWSGSAGPFPGSSYPFINSSPNKYGNGDTYIVWGKAVTSSIAPIGVMPYTYYLSGTISTLDTVTVGAQVFQYFPGHSAMRIV